MSTENKDFEKTNNLGFQRDFRSFGGVKGQGPLFDILNRSFNIYQNYLVEASAGTGKTFSIENLYVRLLLGVREITLEQILVVTFTKAATEELKARIRVSLSKTLETLLLSLEGKDLGRNIPDYLQEVIDRGNEAILLAKRKIEKALFSFKESGIYTIHSFCQKVLKEHTLDHGMSMQDESHLLTPHDRRKVVRDFFRVHVEKGRYSQGQLQIVLKRHFFDSSKLEEAILSILDKGGTIAKIPSFLEAFSLFKDKMHILKKTFTLTGKELLEDFISRAPQYYGTCNKQRQVQHVLLDQITHFGSLFDKRDLQEEDFDRLIVDQLQYVLALDPTKLRPKATKTLFLKYPNLPETLQREIHPIIEQAGSYTSIILKMASDCQNLLGAYQAEESKFQYDDLLKKTEEHAYNHLFCAKIRAQYKVAIVDEFQDTDRIQWEIVRKLFHSKDTLLYLIGDPKQSIYGFRQADIYTYLSAAESIGKESRTSLNINYRSEPKLVEALNTLFSKATHTFIPLPKIQSALEYTQVRACDTFSDQHLRDSLKNLHFCIAETHKDNWSLIEMEKNFFFPFISKEIARLKSNEKIPLNNWAILVRDRFQADRLSEYLKKQKITCQLQRQAFLTDSIMVSALRDVIYAAVCPNDLNAIKQALFGKIIGWPFELLDTLSEEKILNNLLYEFQELSKVLSQKGYISFFYTLMNSHLCKNEKSVIENLLSEPSGNELYNELIQLFENCMQYLPNSTSSENLLVFLENIRNLEKQEEERMIIHQENSQDAVKIMTLHYSKGLEFEIVFPIGLINRTKLKEETLTIPNESKEWIATSKNERPLCSDYYLEQDAEKMRLLYVAMTRAKKRLYLPIVFSNTESESQEGEASCMELFLEQLQVANYEHLEALTEPMDNISMCKIDPIDFEKELFIDKLEQETVVLKPPAKVIVPEQVIQSFSFTSLSKDMNEEDLSNSEKELIAPTDYHSSTKTAHTLPSGSETGKFLHTLLEKISFQDVKNVQSYEDLVAKVPHFFSDSLFNGWENTVCQMVYNTIKTPLSYGDISFSLCDVEENRSYKEIEFLFPQNNVFKDIPDRFLKGVIDYVFEMQGKYYIIDWKSNWLGPSLEYYTHDNLHLAMQKNLYYLQAEIYTEAFKRYIAIYDKRPFEECFGGCFYIFLRGVDPNHPHFGILPCYSTNKSVGK